MNPTITTLPGHERSWIEERLLTRMEMIENSITKWANDFVGGPPWTTADTVERVGDLYLRRGIPVTNGRIEGDAIVFDVIAPSGQG